VPVVGAEAGQGLGIARSGLKEERGDGLAPLDLLDLLAFGLQTAAVAIIARADLLGGVIELASRLVVDSDPLPLRLKPDLVFERLVAPNLDLASPLGGRLLDHRPDGCIAGHRAVHAELVAEILQAAAADFDPHAVRGLGDAVV